MDSFSSILNAGMQTLHRFTSGPACYCRAESGEHPALAIAIQVAWGRTEFEEFSERASLLQSEAEDAIVNDYSSLIEAIGQPRPGDRIVQGNRVREVMSLGEEPCFRYDSAQRHFLRIHTRVIREDR